MAALAKSQLQIVVVVAVVLLLACLVFFYKQQNEFVYMFMQGFWKINDDLYLLVDDTSMKFCEFTSDETCKYNTLVEYSDVCLHVKSPFSLCKIQVAISANQRLSSARIPLGECLGVEITPVIGTMVLKSTDAPDISLVKDSELTLAYFKD